MVFSFSSKADVDDWLRDIDSLRKNGCAFNKRGSGEEGASFSPCKLNILLLQIVDMHIHVCTCTRVTACISINCYIQLIATLCILILLVVQ